MSANNAADGTSVSEYEKTGKLQRKIDVYVKRNGAVEYLHSTQWHRTCRDAVAAALRDRSDKIAGGMVFARFATR